MRRAARLGRRLLAAALSFLIGLPIPSALAAPAAEPIAHLPPPPPTVLPVVIPGEAPGGEAAAAYSSFASLFAASPVPTAGEFGRRARRLIAAAPDKAAVKAWLGKSLAPAFAGLADGERPKASSLKRARSGLPALRALLRLPPARKPGIGAKPGRKAAGAAGAVLEGAGFEPGGDGEAVAVPAGAGDGSAPRLAKAGPRGPPGGRKGPPGAKPGGEPASLLPPPEDPALETLRRRRAELDAADKLAQRTDLAAGGRHAEEIKLLDEMIAKYESLLALEGTESSGATEAAEIRRAALSALKEMFDAVGRKPEPAAPPRRALAGSDKEKEILEQVVRVEALQAQVQAGVASRDAAASLLMIQDKVRAGVLRERRNGKDMLEFRKNFARLATVMDLAYALNILNSALKALAEMQAMLDARVAQIDQQRKANAAAAAAAAKNAALKEQWKKEAEAATAKDKERAGDFATLSEQAALFVLRAPEFKNDMLALVDFINARDKGPSANAVAEYERRLAMLPAIHQAEIHGTTNPQDVGSLSLDYLQQQKTLVEGYLTKMADADARLAEVPVEFAGALIIVVPGIPAVSATNPSAAQVLQILTERRAYWTAEKASYQKILDSVNAYMDPGNAKRVPNDFGDMVPESVVVYKSETQAELSRLKTKGDTLASKADEVAKKVEAGSGATLPRLSGKTPEQLRDLLPAYAEQLSGLVFPDTDEGFIGKMEKIALSKYVAYLADNTVERLEGEAIVKSIDEALAGVLPKARTRFTDLLATLQAVLDDVTADEAHVNAGFPASQNQALIDRKRALINAKLKPTLEAMKTFIEDDLIPFQQGSVDHSDPSGSGDGYSTLYSKKKEVFIEISDGLYKDFPWGLASNGAKEGDVSGARANIAAARKEFDEYKQLVADLKDEIRRRKDPNNMETEVLYGETVPFSLVRRRDQYQAEKVTRAQQINDRDGQVNQMLVQMDTLSHGKYGLAAKYRLPTNISATDPNAGTALRKMADDRVLQNMAAEIQQIADAASQEASSGGGLSGLGGGGLGAGGVPTGTQPPITVSENQQLALLGLEVVKRLVPSSAAMNGDSIAEALARFLFSDALVRSSILNLNERIPIFETFLNKGEQALNAIFADYDADLAFVSSDLSNGLAVPDRKVVLYTMVRDVAKEGADLFNQKAAWSAEGVTDAQDAAFFYESLGEVYASSNQALDAELEAINQFKDTITKAQEDFLKQKAMVDGWMAQLNDPHESALRRVMDNVSAIQDKTKAVLEANIDYKKVEEQYELAKKNLEKTLTGLAKEQQVLTALLEGIVDLNDLSPEAADRVVKAIGMGGSWLAAGGRGPQTIVIPKSRFASFINQLLGITDASGAAATPEQMGLRNELLSNPSALTQLLPNSRMIETGEGSQGFYLVYQSEFSTPGGLETANQMTMGNIASFGENNVSVTGYRFASPPSDVNAPFGDQGVSVTVESLGGKNFVNYLDITFHKFLQDIPKDMTIQSQAEEARMMIFDDFAMMVANNKLYIGGAGFADFATQNTAEKPYYLGGNLKAKLKLTEVVSLNAEESALFAKDPRKFLQTVNLDFTGWDPGFDRDFVISGEGEEKWYRRDKVGVGFDLQKALEAKDKFEVELFFARVTGTDDINQNSVGASVLKGITFQVAGTSVAVNAGVTGELGEEYNVLRGNLSFELPKQGIVLSAQGKILGDAESYYFELKKKMGLNTEAFVGYGSKYVGLNNRFVIGTQTSFTLGELWRAVVGQAAEDLQGGKTLAAFNKSVAGFFQREKANDRLVAELERVFTADVGKKLLSLHIGELTRELNELYKAGAVLDNTRMRGMIGFVSNPIGGGTAEQATGGGFQVGVVTEYTMSKTQKALAQNKIKTIFKIGLELQARLLELTKAWQAALTELAEARWDMFTAAYMVQNADDPLIKAEAQTKALEAADRYRQSVLRYNALTGRGPDQAVVFDEVTPEDIDSFFFILRRNLKRTDRLSRLITNIRGEMDMPKAPFNLMDWIPIFESITFYMGAQLYDMLSSQALGIGVNLRVPIYDPKSHDKALRIEDKAIIREMAAMLKDFRLKARAERELAAMWESQVRYYEAASPGIRTSLSEGIRQYRNGLIGQPEIWTRFRRWHWAMTGQLQARAQSNLKEAWSVLDGAQAAGPDETALAVKVSTGPGPSSLAEAYQVAKEGSLTWESLALRSAAAGELQEEAARRFQKVSVDINIGVNITASGVAFIPAFGITGVGIFPILNVTLQPGELAELGAARRGEEKKMYARLQNKVAGDVALELYQGYATYLSVNEALEVYQKELLPGLEAAQDGSSAAAWRLDKARTEFMALQAQAAQARASINYLLGRPLDAPVSLKGGIDKALTELDARLKAEKPLESNRDVLVSRLNAARAVETIVDKNLKVQNIRFDPLSLIGRSLGRLISTLAGDNVASPELVALARQQTLAAERELMSFDKKLPAARARLRFELAQAQRDLAALEGVQDAESRALAARLRGRVAALKGMLLAYGGAEGAAGGGPSPLPKSYEELKKRLREAFAAEAPSPTIADPALSLAASSPVDLASSGRYFYVHQTIGKEPVGRSFLEGWVEVRLRSKTTPPEALAALADLQTEKADQLYRAELAHAQAKADMLLIRLRLDAALAREAAGSELGRRARQSLERDFAEMAAHLGLEASASAEDILKLLPEDPEGELDAAARLYLSEAASVDSEFLRRTIFADGMPEVLAAAADPLPVLRADLLAEKMTYKGFTPVGAFGIFQGKWVGGAFLETPDPEKIQKNLQALLNDALRRELEKEDRLKGLTLLIHALMASVSDKVKIVAAQRVRLELSRKHLLAVLERRKLGMATDDEAAFAQAEAALAHREFASVLYALRADFIRLVTELEAVGHSSRSLFASRAVSLPPAQASLEKGPREELLAWWSRRMLDPDFEARVDALLGGVPASLRGELRERLAAYRRAEKDAKAVGHKDFEAAEKLSLLTVNDLEGRRRKVEALLGSILDELSKGDISRSPDWTSLMGFLRADVEALEVQAQAEWAGGASVRKALREAYWKAVPAPPAVEEAYQRLSALRDEVSAAKQEALSRYLVKKLAPEDYVLRDKALDAYLRALVAYDAAMLKAFSLPEVSGDPRWARALNALFGLKATLDRRRDHLLHGRGILAIDAALELGTTRLTALKWERGDPEELEAASQTLAFLRGMRERWIKDPAGVPSLYLIKGPEERWATMSDLQALEDKGKLVGFGARRIVMPESYVGKRPETAEEALSLGGAEVVAGVDARSEEARRIKGWRDGIARRAEIDAQLAKAELALVRPLDAGAAAPDPARLSETGTFDRALTLADLRRLEREGRVLYFLAKPHPRNGLRLALHPLAARWRSPEDLVAMVQLSGEALPAGKFPTLEALQSSRFAGLFLRLEFGALGVSALLKEAEGEELEARRRGWLSLKIHAWGYALDKKGEVAAVYLDEAEYAEAVKKKKDEKSREHEWDFHKVADLQLGLDAYGRVAAVKGKGFSHKLGRSAVSRWLNEPVYALEMTDDGRIRRLFTDADELKEESRSWWLEDVTGKVWRDTEKAISPTHRLKGYIDPSTGLRVQLGRPILMRRLKEAEAEGKRVGAWAFGLLNWPNIVLEIPRGIVKTVTTEMIGGRDPNQEGYIGKVNIRQMDGGGTINHHPLVRFLLLFDIFEFYPDKVDFYHDPSQYPKLVDNDSPLRPGEWEHEKSPTSVDGSKDVVFGKGAVEREIGYAKQDLEDMRNGILGFFQGDVRRSFVETTRGRAGTYPESTVDHQTGKVAVEETLKQIGDRTGADGVGLFAEMPEHIAVDKVSVEVRVSLGANQHDARAKAYAEYLKKLKAKKPAEAPSGPSVEDAEAWLSESLAGREAAKAALDAALPSPALPGYPAVPKLYNAVAP